MSVLPSCGGGWIRRRKKRRPGGTQVWTLGLKLLGASSQKNLPSPGLSSWPHGSVAGPIFTRPGSAIGSRFGAPGFQRECRARDPARRYPNDPRGGPVAPQQRALIPRPQVSGNGRHPPRPLALIPRLPQAGCFMSTSEPPSAILPPPATPSQPTVRTPAPDLASLFPFRVLPTQPDKQPTFQPATPVSRFRWNLDQVRTNNRIRTEHEY